jgi:hypothetical protein
MRVNGKWLLCDDGVIRPVVPGFVRAADGQLVEVAFLLDAGADRTVFSADFATCLDLWKHAATSRLFSLSRFNHRRNSDRIQTGRSKRRDRAWIVWRFH